MARSSRRWDESDVMLAAASKGLVLGFNVKAESGAELAAKQQGVLIQTYHIIYELIDGVRAAMEGMLEPIRTEKRLGRAEVRNLFNVPKLGTIAGVSADIETFHFNKAVARLHELANAIAGVEAKDQATKWALRETLEIFVRLIGPMTPHLAEELWLSLGHKTLLADAPWPAAEDALLVDDTVTIAVQLNGKDYYKAKNAAPFTHMFIPNDRTLVLTNLAEDKLGGLLAADGKKPLLPADAVALVRKIEKNPMWLAVPKVSACVSLIAENTRMPRGSPHASACSGSSSPTTASGATSSGSFARSTPVASMISSQ